MNRAGSGVSRACGMKAPVTWGIELGWNELDGVRVGLVGRSVLVWCFGIGLNRRIRLGWIWQLDGKANTPGLQSPG